MITEAELQSGKFLVVDDSEVNILLLDHMLRAAGYASVASTQDPTQVCSLYATNHYDLILLDLQMPVMNGFEVMEALKKIVPDGDLPVIVITAEPGHKMRALNAGAKDFISKPFELAEVLARVRNALEVRLLYKQLHGYNEVLEARVHERTADLHESHLETILTMMRAAEHRDEDTGSHVKRIGHYCRTLADFMGMGASFVDTIFFASPMHDVGKIGIPDHVLLKPGGLTPAEWKIMQGHSTMGAEILGKSKSHYLKMGAEIAQNHHERWDGSGYPAGLRGEAIPVAARLMNICDVYDALRSQRPYKPPMEHTVAIDILAKGDGRTAPAHFDPAVLAAFLEHHDVFRELYDANLV